MHQPKEGRSSQNPAEPAAKNRPLLPEQNYLKQVKTFSIFDSLIFTEFLKFYGVHTGVHPAFIRRSPGVHPAFTRRSPGVHPAPYVRKPIIHPVHTGVHTVHPEFVLACPPSSFFQCFQGGGNTKEFLYFCAWFSVVPMFCALTTEITGYSTKKRL